VSKIHQGKPWPLGSTITKRGVNFCVAAPTAKRLELLIFANAKENHPDEVIHLNNENRSGDYWHIEIEGLKAGCCYGYRVFRDDNIEKNCSHPNKVLLDPCARAISGWDVYQRDAATGTSLNIDNA